MTFEDQDQVKIKAVYDHESSRSKSASIHIYIFNEDCNMCIYILQSAQSNLSALKDVP